MRQVEHLEKTMPLSSYNVNQQLTHYFDPFFTRSHSFNTLHAHLVAKQPIAEIHQKIINELMIIRDEDKARTKATLEQEALTEQLRQDEVEKQRDEENSIRQGRENEQLISELDHKTGLIAARERELTTLNMRIYSRPQTTVVHTHINAAQHTHHTHPSRIPVTHTTVSHPTVIVENDYLDAYRENALRSEIDTLKTRVSTIESTLKDLGKQRQQRRINGDARSQRISARLDLQLGRVNASIYECLSTSNKTTLLSNLNSALQAINAQFTSLEQKAEQLNYDYFRTRLKQNIGSSGYSRQDIEALEQIMSYMEQHLNHVADASSIQQRLDNTNNTLNTNQNNLRTHQARVWQLERNSPELTQQNESLTNQNRELQPSKEKNIKLRNQLFIPTMVFGVLTLAIGLPLLLAFTAPPVLFFIIPAITLLATIGCGIASLVYQIKGKRESDNIARNVQTIDSNTMQMQSDQQELLRLNNQTIPTCQRTIREHTQRKSEIETSLRSTQQKAQEALEKAKAIKPVTPLPTRSPSQPIHETQPDSAQPTWDEPTKPVYPISKPEPVVEPDAPTKTLDATQVIPDVEPVDYTRPSTPISAVYRNTNAQRFFPNAYDDFDEPPTRTQSPVNI